MTPRRLTVAMFCIASCADADEPTLTVVNDHAQVRTKPILEEDSICDRLPSCGPCALLCDLPALTEQYVPVGTCAAFVCELTDGTEAIVHACHPAD